MLEVDHIRVCSLAKILFERANSEEAYKDSGMSLITSAWARLSALLPFFSKPALL